MHLAAHLLLMVALVTVPLARVRAQAAKGYPAMWLDPANCSIHSGNPDALGVLAEMASLSNNTYLSSDAETKCRTMASASNSKACDDFMPMNSWHVVGGNGENSPTGLGYRIYQTAGTGKKRPKIAFAFRGTEIFSGKDWLSNFAIHADDATPQQAEALVEVKRWISENRRSWNLKTGAGMDAEDVYMTGHSLGGGIAQYLAYQLPRITAIVFNPSPRTGYRSISRAEYTNPPVCRMRESWEVVYTLVGGPVPNFYPNRHSCGFINVRTVPFLFSAHSIRAMADALTCYARDARTSACEKYWERAARAMDGAECL